MERINILLHIHKVLVEVVRAMLHKCSVSVVQLQEDRRPLNDQADIDSHEISGERILFGWVEVVFLL